MDTFESLNSSQQRARYMYISVYEKTAVFVSLMYFLLSKCTSFLFILSSLQLVLS